MWRPFRLGCSRWVPDRVANYEPQKEPDPSEQLPIVLQSTFRSRRTLMMCAPAMCGPPDPGRLGLFEGPYQRGRISKWEEVEGLPFRPCQGRVLTRALR